jgi:multiple sugar transport system substrate-binding protein
MSTAHVNALKLLKDHKEEHSMSKSRIGKSLSILLTVVMMVTLLLGCGAGKDSSQGSANESDTTNAAEATEGTTEPAEQTPAVNPDEKVELRVAWWGSQNRHDKTMKVIEMFQAKYPNITISPEFTGWGGYWDKLTTQAAGQNMPDVVQMDYSRLMEFVAKGLLTDLTPFADSSAINLGKIDEAYIESGRADGKLYALSLGSNAPALAYDPAVFAEAGVAEPQPGYTWDDLADIAAKLKEKKGKDFYPIGKAANDDGYFNIYVREKGFERYNAEGNGLGFEDDQIVSEWFAYWDKLNKDGLVAPISMTATIQNMEEQLLAKNKAAMMFINSNEIIALQSAAGRDIKLTVLPKLADGENGLFLKPSMFFSISENSAHKDAAAKFIDFFTNDIEANKVLEAERGVPISSDVREELGATLGGANKNMFDYIELAQQHAKKIYPPEPAGAIEAADAFNRIAEAMNFKKTTPDEAAKQFRNEATKALNK